MSTASVESLLKQLRMSGILATLEQRVMQAREHSLSHQEFLNLILQDEIQKREATSLSKRLSCAKFEDNKTIEGLKLERYPTNIQQRIRDLICGKYLAENKHILIVGPTGTGKTHLAQALGHQACRQGKKVRFIRASVLFRLLNASRADQSWEKEFKRLLSFELLIIDDFGLKTLTPVQAEDIYEIIAERSLKGSFIFTSNRKIEAWVDLFPDPVMANAALDRLSHQSYHIVLEGKSYRRETRTKFENEDKVK